MCVCWLAGWRIKEKHVIANLTYIVHVSLNKDLCTHLHAYSALPKQPRVLLPLSPTPTLSRCVCVWVRCARNNLL